MDSKLYNVCMATEEDEGRRRGNDENLPENEENSEIFLLPFVKEKKSPSREMKVEIKSFSAKVK